MRDTPFATTLFLAALALVGTAVAQTDDERARWFKSLKQPGSITPCCDVSDCERTEADWRNGQWWAIVRGVWMPIPHDRELSVPSIDGAAYVCSSYAKDRMIFCFVPPNMAM